MADEHESGPLSLERNESIFRNDILPDYLPTTMTPAERPRLIVLGGQSGAGKTGVLIASHAELEQSGSAIRIVGDDLRSYHPQSLSFQRQDPETASQFTQLDAGRWTEKLLAAATERKVNIVFETTMRTPKTSLVSSEWRERPATRSRPALLPSIRASAGRATIFASRKCCVSATQRAFRRSISMTPPSAGSA